MLSGALTGMQQHILDDRVGARAVLYHFIEIALQHICDLIDLLAQLAVEVRATESLTQFIDKLDRNRREIVDKIERILDLMGDACSQLPKRGKLLCLDEAILRSPQILQRSRQLASARFHVFE